jgi:copper(I)-binding protein
MRDGRSGPAALVVLLLLLTAGCVYYPGAADVGGVRLVPEKGRLLRSATANEATLYFDLASMGKYGDVLTGVESPLARRASLVAPDGSNLSSLEIPGETVVRFHAAGPRVVLSELTRPVVPGEVVIVTLRFEKSGAIGVISVVE